LIELSGRYASAGANTRLLAAVRDHVPGCGGENDGNGDAGAIAAENETRTSAEPPTLLAPAVGEIAVTRSGASVGGTDVEVELAPDVRVVVVTPGEGLAARLRWLTANAATAPAATRTATATSKRSGVTVRVQRRCG
jgi:hypothetical protein